MNSWQLSLFVMTTFFTAAITTLLAVYAWRHREAAGAEGIAATMFFGAYWSCLAALEVISPAQADIWHNLKYAGIAGTAASILLLALQYTQQRWWERRRLWWLYAAPALTQLVIWTNPWHGLWLTAYDRGPWFWIHAAYSFGAVFIGMILLGVRALQVVGVQRRQTLVLLAGFPLPLMINVLLTFGVIPYVADFTPFGLAVTGLMFAWAVYGYRLLDLAPLAREALIDGLQDGMLVINLQAQVVDYNPAAEAILQRAPSAPVLRPDVSLLPAWPQLLAQAAQERLAQSALSLAQVDGRHYYEVLVKLLVDKKQAPAGYLVVLHDVTVRQQAEDALRRYAQDLEASNAELDAFAHTVAHDLQTPLTALLGFSTLQERRATRWSVAEFQQNAQRMTEVGQKMGNIIHELLLLAGVRKMQAVETTPLEMAVIVEGALLRFGNHIREVGAEVQLPDVWPSVVGYGPWIEEVWVNYLSNALKYGGRPESSIPPLVEVGYAPVFSAGRIYVRFWVQDNGPGLTLEQCAQLFTQFTRLHQQRAEGHGLGLSIVQRIVEKLGGQVGVESTLGVGSRFWFTLLQAAA